MLILTDRALAEAKVDFRTAVALLEPAEGTLIVHVRQELGPSDYVPPPSTDGGGGLRHTHEGEPQAERPVPTEEPPKSTGHPMPEDLGHTLMALSDEAKKRRLDLVCLGQGVYSLQGVMGQRFYSTLGQVAAALRFNRW
jgi:hypothetical protein